MSILGQRSSSLPCSTNTFDTNGMCTSTAAINKVNHIIIRPTTHHCMYYAHISPISTFLHSWPPPLGYLHHTAPSQVEALIAATSQNGVRCGCIRVSTPKCSWNGVSRANCDSNLHRWHQGYIPFSGDGRIMVRLVFSHRLHIRYATHLPDPPVEHNTYINKGPILNERRGGRWTQMTDS